MTNSTKYDVIVIGAGLAGLACGIRLKKRGKSVLIIEKNETVGGKLDELAITNFRWDKGPSLFTQPEKVDELFKLWGKNPREYFNYDKLSESCRYFFEDDSNLVFSDSVYKTIHDPSNNLFIAEQIKLDRYAAKAKEDYHNIGHFFLENPKPGLRDLFSKAFLRRYPFFLKKRMRSSLNSYNQQFKDDRLIKVFNRFGTYNGSNPYKMSGLYSMISNLELNEGSYFPLNGMRSIPNALYQLALEIGIEFIFNTKPQILKTQFNYTVKFEDITLETENVVCAIDHLTFYRDVLNDSKLLDSYSKQERSTSGLVFYWGINRKIESFGVHNILFSENYEEEFKSLFDAKKCTEKPTIYVHISSIVSAIDAPSNGQNLFIMINTPANHNPSEDYRSRMKEYVISKIKRTTGIEISENIVAEDYWDNSIIENRTGSYLGALYGASSNSKLSALTRHGNVSKKYDNLYFCGGTVHPGGGIPLVLTSAKIVAETIK